MVAYVRVFICFLASTLFPPRQRTETSVSFLSAFKACRFGGLEKTLIWTAVVMQT